MDPALGERGVAEVTVRDVPMKPPALATLKSNNYLLNCLTAMRACDQGGHFGVLVDENGMVNAAQPLHTLRHPRPSAHSRSVWQTEADGGRWRRSWRRAAC
jgi:hypothetical protein